MRVMKKGKCYDPPPWVTLSLIFVTIGSLCDYIFHGFVTLVVPPFHWGSLRWMLSSFSNFPHSSKMFPKTSLSNTLIMTLRCFNFCCSWYIVILYRFDRSSHHVSIFRRKSRCSIHNFSKWNNFGCSLREFFHDNRVGQRSKPSKGWNSTWMHNL